MTTPITHLRQLAALAAVGLLLPLNAQAQSPALDPTFAPPVLFTVTDYGLRVDGTVNDLVRQPDGKYVIGGDFQEVNGVAVPNIARLLPDGTLDASFTAAADGPVLALALQPDGNIIVGGNFQRLDGQLRSTLGRLLPSGALDTGFAPRNSLSSGTGVNSISLQPDGRILIGGFFNVRGEGATPQQLDRLDGTTGLADASFRPYQPVSTVNSYATVNTHLLLPNGKILVGGEAGAYRYGTLLRQFNADGTPDESFPVLQNYFTSGIRALAADAAGNYYAAGMYNTAPNGGDYVRRLQANGSTDFTFIYRGSNYEARALALQPNGRIIVGNGTMERLMPNGSVDTGFGSVSANGGSIRRLLVQADGTFMVAGRFSQLGSAPAGGLVRMTAANVLHAKPAADEARLAVWPVPAHHELHLRLDPADRPQKLQLLDALGRPVRTITEPTAMLRLPVADLPAGTYQLLVHFADGRPAIRRVVLQ